MSFGTSTDRARLPPDGTQGQTIAGRAGRSGSPGADAGLQPWQFFLLATLVCATAVTFLARGQGTTAVVLLSLLIGTAGLIGIAALRTFAPLVSPEEDRTAMVGSRTRAALEREKTLTLRAIKELEFDRAMGKLSEDDWHAMSGRLRARAGRLMKQLDAGAGYRERIEHDLAARLGRTPDVPEPLAIEHLCAQCHTQNDPDARFCKNCGRTL